MPTSIHASHPTLLSQSSLPKRDFSSLDILEAEAGQILLSVAATLNPAALMFSAGKDSACIAHVARKLFTRLDESIHIPFAFFHYDSNDNFDEVLAFRERLVDSLNADLTVFNVVEASRKGLIKSELDHNGNVHAIVELINYSQTEFGIKALIGGGRRDEDPVRSKERIFSLRDENGLWQPYNQRPEVWDLHNTQILPGQHLRVFPISNWTEKNVWEYITRENIDLPSIYYAHEREVIYRSGAYLAYFPEMELLEGEKIEIRKVRCRSIGDKKTTGFFESSATTPEEVLQEVYASEYSERSGRAEDHRPDTGMQNRKEKGWF